MSNKFSQTFKDIDKETNQQHELRRPYFQEIKNLRKNRTVISLFISFKGFSPLSQQDSDILEEVLSNEDNSNGISLILDAPGGDGLAAERIIRVCKSYSGADFEVIVPARAKSAATMICLGADTILMSMSSELGPIDPQVVYDSGQGPRWTAAHSIVSAYEELFNNAVKLKNGDIAPYLQQLSGFNAVEIKSLKSAMKLSDDIAVSSLKNGMMKKAAKKTIEKKIKPFTDPTITFAHGRGINVEQAKACGLNIEEIPLNSQLWAAVRGLHMRSQYLVNNTRINKIVETVNESFVSHSSE